jgi:hypothetical protein
MDSANSGQQQQQDQASTGPGTSTGTNPGTSTGSQETKTQTGLDLGNIFNQCSVSRAASIKMTVTEVKGGGVHHNTSPDRDTGIRTYCVHFMEAVSQRGDGQLTNVFPHHLTPETCSA